MQTINDEFRHCPHCGRLTRHSIVSERVLAPVLWCLGCFHTRIGDDRAAAITASSHASHPDAGQVYQLAG